MEKFEKLNNLQLEPQQQSELQKLFMFEKELNKFTNIKTQFKT